MAKLPGGMFGSVSGPIGDLDISQSIGRDRPTVSVRRCPSLSSPGPTSREHWQSVLTEVNADIMPLIPSTVSNYFDGAQKGVTGANMTRSFLLRLANAPMDFDQFFDRGTGRFPAIKFPRTAPTTYNQYPVIALEWASPRSTATSVKMNCVCVSLIQTTGTPPVVTTFYSAKNYAAFSWRWNHPGKALYILTFFRLDGIVGGKTVYSPVYWQRHKTI